MPTPPIAEQRQHATTHHGVTRQDPYHWLRAENWQEVMEDPGALPADIRTYLEAENGYFAEAFEQPTAELREAIYREIRGRIKEDDADVPAPDGPWAYNVRTREGEQYAVIVRTPRGGGEEQVLLDCNVEAGDGYFGFGGADHDPHHNLLAWSADRQGSETYTVYLRDLGTGVDTGEVIEETAGDLEWSNDGLAIYYTELDDSHRPFRVRRHVLGTTQSEDEIVYEEADPGFFVGIGKTLSRRFILVEVHDHQTSESWLIDGDAGGPPRLVAARVPEREYDVEECQGLLFLLTNADGAEDFKVVAAPADTPGAENWRDFVAHTPGVLILDLILLREHMVRLERFEGLPRIVVRDLRTDFEETVAFPEEAYSLSVWAGYEFDATTVRFSYSSPTTPSRIYELDLQSGERTLLKEQVVPSGHDPAAYETHRIFATAADGERVPVTLLHRKGIVHDGSNPVLLYGYGAYGMSMPAAFSVSALSLVDRGFVHAIAHVRGGTEKGYGWYRNGRRENKRNTFNDFIAAAETLIQDGYTAPGKIIAEGGSAGGLLVGVVANERSELWAGIVAEVPFVDILNTMLDATLPLTPPEWPEWGNPLEDGAAFARIGSYAPYEQVKPQAYPPIFVLAGLTDPRVTYWEPAKWVAKLRATTSGEAPIYLKTNMGAGHGGPSGRFEHIKETALSYAFALQVTGLA
jgi:oligopeptidase B